MMLDDPDVLTIDIADDETKELIAALAKVGSSFLIHLGNALPD